jgi:hypothetical protein
MQDIRYERCFRMEGEFQQGLRQIFARIGLTGPAMDQILGTERNVSPKDEAPVYSAELAARVHRLYARDFEVFGYDAESWRGL